MRIQFFAVVLSIAVGFGLAGVAAADTPTNSTATPDSTATPNVTATPTPTPNGTVNATATPTRAGTITPTPTPPPEPEPEPTPEPTTAAPDPSGEPSASSDVIQTLDEDTNLTGWSYADGVFTLTFEHSGAPSRLTITEATQTERGASRFTVRREVITAGTTTLRVRSRIQAGESALGIASAQSMRQGHGIIVSTGTQGADPFAPFGGTSGVFSGVGLSILLSASAAGWVIWREDSGVIKA